MHLEPLANRVVVEEIDEGKLTSGGLWKPDIARKNALSYCTVLAVGPGRHAADGRLIPCHVKEGQVVMVPRSALAVLPLKDEQGSEKEFLLCYENDIIGVIHGMPQRSRIVGMDNSYLSLSPQSLARPDSAYANEDAFDRTIADLRQSKAPEDVIAEVSEQLIDGVD